MADKRGKHPNARAHQFKPGESGNPNGRPAGLGSSVREWLNNLGEKPLSDIQAVLADANSPAAKVVAARRLISAMADSSMWKEKEGLLYRVGDTPGPGIDFDRVMDRTEGKPAQKHEIEANLTHHLKVIERVKQQ